MQPSPQATVHNSRQLPHQHPGILTIRPTVPGSDQHLTRRAAIMLYQLNNQTQRQRQITGPEQDNTIGRRCIIHVQPTKKTHSCNTRQQDMQKPVILTDYPGNPHKIYFADPMYHLLTYKSPLRHYQTNPYANSLEHPSVHGKISRILDSWFFWNPVIFRCNVTDCIISLQKELCLKLFLISYAGRN